MNAAIDIRPIRTDEDHNAALAAIERLCDAEEGTEAYGDLAVLTTIEEAYEAKRWPITDGDLLKPLRPLMQAVSIVGPNWRR